MDSHDHHPLGSMIASTRSLSDLKYLEPAIQNFELSSICFTATTGSIKDRLVETRLDHARLQLSEVIFPPNREDQKVTREIRRKCDEALAKEKKGMLVFFVVLICLLINGVYSTIWKPVSLKWSAESGIYDAQRCGLPLSNSAVANKTKSETNLTSPTTKPTRFKRFHEELEDENRHQKIMGGTDATDGELPWAVALYLKDRYICTGTLITKKHVITAGHCFGNEKSQDAGGCKDTDYLPVQEMLDQLEVWTGGVCLPQTACNSTHKMVKHLVKKVTYQPFFQQRCREGDMALLELDDEVDPVPPTIYVCRNTSTPLNWLNMRIGRSKQYHWCSDGTRPEWSS
uniref:Peptidase S1 domain-containing protein n=1 Tax=Ditylenchus dipsaci TaxID=166011 RepID=A0A915DBT4_9BILA